MVSRHAPRERVSWNDPQGHYISVTIGHAPRERVSWNLFYCSTLDFLIVTLHVSVWVEIPPTFDVVQFGLVTLHVSVWVEMQAHDI